MRSVVITLDHGLGNQMFQYAYGRYLARRWQIPVRFDTSLLRAGRSRSGRSYALDIFELALEEANPRLVRALTTPIGRRWSAWAQALVRRDVPPPLPIQLRGFWQDWRFPEAIRDELRLAFTFRAPSDPRTPHLRARVDAAPDAVAVHVWRGDYVGNPRFDVRLPSYFRDAIGWMRHHIGQSAPVWVFSDGIEWCEAQLGDLVPRERFVPDDLPTGDTLNLMASCRHQVISNSSFSWWAAWLAAHPRQRVVCPDRWEPGPGNQARLLRMLMPDWVPLPARA